MFKRKKVAQLNISAPFPMFPHCDQKVLHAPKNCRYCDMHPDWQRLREAWGIAFTGEAPRPDGLPCPADLARFNHYAWPGNRAYPEEVNPDEKTMDRARKTLKTNIKKLSDDV